MDLAKVLADLRAELDTLDNAIASLERLRQADLRREPPTGWVQKSGKTTSLGSRKVKASSRHAGEFPPTEGA